jgi:hypothetical protein
MTEDGSSTEADEKYSINDFLSADQLNEDVTLGELIEEDDRNRGELVKASLDSTGREVFQDVQTLYSTLRMVNMNYDELTQARDWFLEQDMKIFYWNHQDEAQKFMSEYSRLLHNYAASVHTLISHSYTFVDRYEEERPELKTAYFRELRSRDLTVRGDLVKGLRHYTQKYWQAPIGLTLCTGHDSATERAITVDVETLLEWDGWDQDVEEYLQGLDERENITNIAGNYQEDINDFYDWFHVQVLTEFYDEILDMVVAQAKLEQQREDTRMDNPG